MNPKSCTTPLRHGVTKYLFALIALCLAATLHAQTTYLPVFTNNTWNVAAGTYVDLPTSGNNDRGLAINPVTTNVLYASTAGGSNHVAVLSFANGSYLGALSGSGVSGGNGVGLAGLRVANDGAVYACNVTVNNSSTFKLYRWASDSDFATAPATVYSQTSPLWRCGDYMDVRGSGTNTEIVVVGNGSGANITTNFIIFRPTDATCLTFTNFTITIPGGLNNYCGGGVAFEGTNNAIWIRQSANQSTRHVSYNPTTLTAVADRTNNVDQSVCQGLKYYSSTNGTKLLATVQTTTSASTPQICRVFSVSASANSGTFVSVMTSNLSVAATSYADGNSLGSVDIQNGYFAFSAPNNGISLYQIGFNTQSPPSIGSASASASYFVAGYNLNAVFNSSVTGSTPLSYQWYFTDSATFTNLILNATNSSYTVTNVQPANAGGYYVIVTNLYGKATSSVPTIVVWPNGGSTLASNLWTLTPGSRPYLTTDDTQRGLGYDTNTHRLVLVTRQPTNGIILLNGADGSDAGNLDISALLALGSLPGTYPINMCGVGDDGVVYVCDLTTGSTANDFSIYSWGSADPSASIYQAYIGNPMASAGYTGSLCRLGDSMAVRGAGINTEILCTCRNGTNAVIFTTANGVDFNANIIYVTNLVASIGSTDPFTGGSPLALGVAFGAGNTFWAKTSPYNLRLVSFDLNSDQAAVIGSYAMPASEGPLGVDIVNGYAGLIGVNETPMNLGIFDITTPNGPTINTLVDREAFGVNNINGNGTGSVAFDIPGGRIFSLSSDSGILALTYAPRLFYTPVAGGISISWTGPGTLQFSTNLLTGWSNVVSASPYTSTASAQQFFRVVR